MFVPLTGKERHTFFHQNDGCYIPGYTGHCPTLRFQYGTSYGSRTKEILQDLRDKNVLKSIQRSPYRQYNEHDTATLQPIPRKQGQTTDPKLPFRNKASKYIIGYTGFIPTINFRYGKSFGRAADDSMYDFSTKQRILRQEKLQLEKLRSQSAPKLTSIRNADDVKFTIRRNHETNDFKERQISPEFPPITGYTGYVPKVKGNEESLSQRYNNVVKRSLTLLREEKQNYLHQLQNRRDYLSRNKDNTMYDETYHYKEP